MNLPARLSFEDIIIDPDPTFFPFMPTVTDFVGGLLFLALIGCVAIFIGAAITLAVAKISGSQRVSNQTSSVLLVVLVLSMVIGAAAPIISWATSIPLGF